MDPKRRTMWRRIGRLCFLVLGFLLAGCSNDESDGVKITHLEKPYPQPEPMEVNVSPILESDQVTLDDGTLMLKVDRSIGWGLGGSVTLLTEFTIQTDHNLISKPNEKAKLMGFDESEAEFVINAYGTKGSHTSSFTVPVRYEVGGFFYPAPRCEFEIALTETIYFSRMTTIDTTLFGEISGDFTSLDDTNDIFNLSFKQGSYSIIVTQDMGAVSFEVSDIVLPEGTGCEFK